MVLAFTIAAVMLTLLTTAANAQARRPAGEDGKKKTDQKIQVDEGAYKAAL
jgi:hypothetical protein